MARALQTADDGTVVPILLDEPTSLVAFALKSKSHRDAVTGDGDGDKDVHGDSDGDTESQHVVYEFAPSKMNKNPNMKCTVFYAKQFFELRQRCMVRHLHHVHHNNVLHFLPHPYPHLRLHRLVLQDGEDLYTESLSRCGSWVTSGGKSGVGFGKTTDDRFIIKYVKRREFHMYLDMAGMRRTLVMLMVVVVIVMVIQTITFPISNGAQRLVFVHRLCEFSVYIVYMGKAPKLRSIWL